VVRVDEQTNKQTNKQTTDAIIIIKCNIFLQGRQTNKQQTLLLLLKRILLYFALNLQFQALQLIYLAGNYSISPVKRYYI
jgi:hypothetical protein